jgi:uncharacterized membrane protein YqjE
MDAQAETAGGPLSRLLHSTRGLLATLIEITHTRLELASTELQEELNRAAVLLLWSAIALFTAGTGLLLGAVTVVVAFWDTHRLLASVLASTAFLVVALVAAFVVAMKLRSKPPLLNETLAELRRDRQALRRLS